jgi:hypothetical protein
LRSVLGVAPNLLILGLSEIRIQGQVGNAPVVLSDLDTWLENAYPLLSTTYSCGGLEEQFVSTWLLAPKFETL